MNESRMRQQARYGIYYCPGEDSELYRTASNWLGRDAAAGIELDPTLPAGIDLDEWRCNTESPRRYGFHATLKAPFRLAEDFGEADLFSAVEDYANRRVRFEESAPTVSLLGRFLALTLESPSRRLHEIADDCVRDFDRFRAAATEEELANRLRGRYSDRERGHIHRWGYPYVFDTWKFHMTLTNSLPEEVIGRYRKALGSYFNGICAQPLVFDSICIFSEEEPGAPFILKRRFSFGGAS